MRKLIYSGLLFLSISAAAQQPILTLKQQLDLAAAQQVYAIESDKLRKIPGFKEQLAKVQTAEQKLITLQEQYCQSKDGKKYHLANIGGVWSCQTEGAK